MSKDRQARQMFEQIKSKNLVAEIWELLTEEAINAIGFENVNDAVKTVHQGILAEALSKYTNPLSPEYQPEFDAQIRSLRPDWFEDEMEVTA